MSYIVELLTAALCLVLLVASLSIPKYKEKLGLFTGICLLIILVISLFNGGQTQTLLNGA